MADLRCGLTNAGLDNVVTYIQSGNLVCDSDRSGVDVAGIVGEVLNTDFGLTDVPTVVRTSEQLDAVVAGNPFPEAASTPKQLHVYFCQPAPQAAAVEAFASPRWGEDRFATAQGELYVAYHTGAGSSKLTLSAIERGLNLQATGRNWSTVLKLQELSR